MGNVLLSLQNNTLSRANLSDESGIAKNVHYGDVLIKFGEVLDVRKEKLPMITDENVLSKYKASFLQNGDVIVADTAEDSTVGKCSEIAGLNDEVVLSGLHTIPYRPIEKFASGYLGYYLNSGAYHNQLIPLMQGIKVTSISKSAMQNTDIDYPKSQEEQGKIGAYFKSLDEMITLHQRKCYRFIDIALDAWEQRKLDGWGTFYYGRSCPKWSVTEDATIPCIRYGELYTKFGAKIDRVYSYTNMPPENLRFSKGTEVLIPRVGEDPMDYNHCTWLSMPDVAIGEMISVFNTDNNPLFTATMFNATLQNEFAMRVEGGSVTNLYFEKLKNIEVSFPSIQEQEKIAAYFENLDHLITLHQRKCEETKSLKKYMLQKMFPENGKCVPKIRFSGFSDDWEQRKVSEIGNIVTGSTPKTSISDNYGGEFLFVSPADIQENRYVDETITTLTKKGFDQGRKIREKASLFVSIGSTIGKVAQTSQESTTNQQINAVEPYDNFDDDFIFTSLENISGSIKAIASNQAVPIVNKTTFGETEIKVPSELAEQQKIGAYFRNLDHLITLHQYKLFCAKNVMKYITTDINTPKKEAIMAELESVIEQKLIEQLIYGDSQWTYREDLKTEADLWKNFRYILEQNNKERLNGEPLSDVEFEQVKNQLQFSSFYKAGEWLVGENGKVMVHVQRDTERLHLVVMNHEHIAGGSSVYEVINQYNALKMDEDSSVNARDRRFDVTLMINGLPMIHIELKNKQHSYMDGFRQIKKYIGEGKFTGIFSAVQMFVISNGVDTKYFSAASDTELNPKFISGWLDKENNAVSDYLDFAKSVLRIPEAHEMIARYTVLDEEAKSLILLRPYQIHAIEAIRDASKTGKSGFVWHTTGSGKTLTSYKATRNLLMDIPAIDKAIFLIDRKDLDTQTTMAFQAYANNDLIDVDETDNVFDLKKKLKSDDRQVIVTTIQKLQRLITRKLQEGTPEYHKIKNLKIAFVVDECHRAVTPGTKREIERFFGNSLWYGFTGTPRFAENPYPQMGDLPRTTQELYGDCLHKYTIQNAIHDNAVLGFQVEHNGPKNKKDETDSNLYVTESHMLKVLEVILNKSYYKLGFQNGKGKTYEGLLTTSSIQLAQKYYDLLKMVKEGKTTLKIDEKIKQVLPDFPKFAITYSVTENEEGSHVNQQKMQESLDDYNKMFGTKYEISQIQGYNGNLNKRLARKDAKYKSRNEQLDLVIVVDRLLTGFDAPCLSTIFIDRPPMGPHDLIQAFSRTNRIYDKNKVYGQIVTFQAPKLFKESVDNAVRLYSAGSTQTALLADWKEVESAFRKSLKALRISAETPEEVPGMSIKEKKIFVKLFQDFDKFFAQLKSFTQYEDNMLAGYGITEDEYTDYAGQYLNAKEEIKEDTDGQIDDPGVPVVDEDYELMAYSHTKIDYEYIINLIQNIVSPDEESQDVTQEQKQKQMDEVKQYVEELRKDNPKVAEIMTTLIGEIEQDVNKYKGQSILNIVENMKQECIEKVVTDFCITWYTSKDDVMYAAMHYRNGEIPNESAIKETANFTSYKEVQERAIPKFKYYTMMIAELRKTLDEEIKPLMNH